MNSSWRVALAAVVLMGTIFGFVRHEHGKGPAIWVPDPVLTVHETIQSDGVQIRHYRVDFKNSGSATLHTKSVTTSCGCTTAELPAPVPPGQSRQLDLQVTIPSGVLDNKVVQVALRSDAINQPVATFTLKMYIRQVVSVMDGSVDFGDIAEDASGSQGFTVSYATATTLHNSSATGGNCVVWSPMNVKTQQMKEISYQTFTGKLSLTAAGTIGRHQETLHFVHPEDPAAVRSVSCTWNVVPKARMVPETIVLDHGAQGSANCLLVSATPILQDPVLDYDRRLISVQLGNKLAEGQREVLVHLNKPRVPARTQTSIQVRLAGGRQCRLLATLLPDK